MESWKQKIPKERSKRNFKVRLQGKFQEDRLLGRLDREPPVEVK